MNDCEAAASLTGVTGRRVGVGVIQTPPFLVAVAAAEQGRPTLMFLTKEAVRLATTGVAVGVACDGWPRLGIDEPVVGPQT